MVPGVVSTTCLYPHIWVRWHAQPCPALQSWQESGDILSWPKKYAQSPYWHCGFPRVRLEHYLNLKGWNSHVHRDFLGIFPESLTQAMLVGTMLVGILAVYTLRQWGVTWRYIRRFARDMCERTGIGDEVRHGVTLGVSSETCLNRHVTRHLHREYTSCTYSAMHTLHAPLYWN